MPVAPVSRMRTPRPGGARGGVIGITASPLSASLSSPAGGSTLEAVSLGLVATAPPVQGDAGSVDVVLLVVEVEVVLVVVELLGLELVDVEDVLLVVVGSVGVDVEDVL